MWVGKLTQEKGLYINYLLTNMSYLNRYNLLGKQQGSLKSGVRFGGRIIGQLEGITFKFYPNPPVNGIVYPQICEQENVSIELICPRIYSFAS